MEEVEILDELHGLDGELKSFPLEAHWFCPKMNDDDFADYAAPDEAEEDMSVETKHELIKDAGKRQKIAYNYSLIFGLDPLHCGQMLADYTAALRTLLTKCDKCVLNWHSGRRAYLKDLAEKFDNNIAAALSQRLNQLDIERIDRGLRRAQEILEQADPSQRTQGFLVKHDMSAVLALYEALCCAEYHKDDELLRNHFDYVFQEVQLRKVLRIADMLPAMARFLFDHKALRSNFATESWQRFAKQEGQLTTTSFDWIVHDALYHAIAVSAYPNAPPEVIQRFWTGFLLIFEVMDEKLIKNSLSGMEIQPDIYRLVLQHFSCSSDGALQAVLQAFQKILERAPKEFWSSMGSISPSAVIEEVFKSQGFERMLMNSAHTESLEDSSAVAWVTPFLTSLSPANKYEACRTLLQHLFVHLQGKQFQEGVKLKCIITGLEALHTTLHTFVQDEYRVNASTSLIIIGELMSVVEQFKGMIMQCAEVQVKNEMEGELKRLARLVIHDSLSLDCKAVSAEFFAHAGGQSVVQRGTRTHSQELWQAVLDIFRPGNIELAKSILPASVYLIGMDELRPRDRKHPERMPKDHVQFNKDLHTLLDNIARIFERLSDFSPGDISQLCQDTKTARPLFAALISVDQGISEAAVEVIKAMSGEIGKRDAFQSLLETSFVPMLNSLTFSTNQIALTATFGSTPYIVKTGRELLKALTGNTGVLRARSGNFSDKERSVITGWWRTQWHALQVMFNNTETWAPRVDKSNEEMQSYLRDCMEYAEELFDQYRVFASATRAPALSSGSVDDSSVEKKKSSRASLIKILKVVCENVKGLVQMLRLRDGYLISVASSLLVKLLGCLGEYDLEIDSFSSTYIKDACNMKSAISMKKTNLTSQQKAELQRALDDHQGVVEIDDPSAVIKKQSTLEVWSKSTDGKKRETKSPQTPSSINQTSTPSADGRKSVLEMMKKREAANAKASDQNVEAFKAGRKAEEEARKNFRAEAAAKAQALRAPVGVKGEGSSLREIGGIAGKDHAPVRNEIMVSSDESSDDDDVDEAGALIKTQRQRNKKVSEYEESRRRAMAKPTGPVKKTKVQRSAKDLRARVEPNMDRLYLEILNWEIFHTGDTPPSNNQCRRIDNKYVDLDLYKQTFGPLLISEVWRSLVTAKDENNYKPVEIKVLNRISVDKFIEVNTSMPIAYNKELRLSERDIVILGRSPDPMNNQKEPHCLARVDRTTRKKDVIEITYRVSRDVKNDLLQSFCPNGKVYCVKIADMTTTQREYAALSSLEYYDLCTEVLEAKPSPLQKYSEEKINSTSLKYKLNKGQANAILSATDNDGFTLIQGPPGSGKTKTIVAMVGALLTPTLQQQREEQARLRPPPGKTSAPAPPPKKKLLICAPSNAAVDELVVRLKEGVLPLNGVRQGINVIRIGRSDAINSAVKDVTLDELVRMKLEGDSGEQNKLINERDKVHKDALAVKERLNVIRPLLDAAEKAGDKAQELSLKREFDSLKRQQAHLGAKIDEDKSSGNTMNRQNEINRRRFQQEIIDGAHVLCSTLSGSGHDMFRNLNVEFETVIIDEAAQCIELSALIPLKYGCSKCILVGDPEQLPPTVLSRSAQSFGYEQSLFVRMQLNHPKDIHLLDTQYRMHPEISVFPSNQFYGGRLIDGDGMAKLRDQPWHASTILGPYRFFDVKGVQTKEARGYSFINIPELNAAIGLYKRLKADFKDYDFKGKIGIIATYKAQLNELRIRFERQFGQAIFEEIEFNTTDAFQGREREIIIFSCVRAKATGGIGFLSDIRRMNVGLTRAKSSLWVLGDSNALQQGEFWNRLIQDAKARDRYTGGEVLELLKKPTTRDRQALREQQLKAEPQVKTTERHAGPTNGNGPPNGLPSRVKEEDSDVEMIDAPNVSSSISRKSSIASVAPAVPPSAPKPRTGLAGLGIRQESSIRKNPITPQTSAAALQPNRPPKRAHSPREDGPSKRSTPKPESELDKAFREHEASKSKSATPTPPTPNPRPGGPNRPPVAPRRRKAPADPFIQKKKPPPKR